MRPFLAGLALILLPSLADAQCVCTCVRGRAIPACPANSLVEPICQQICTDRVEQSLTGGGLGGGGGAAGGGLSGDLASGSSAAAAAAARAAGIDAAAAKALLGR